MDKSRIVSPVPCWSRTRPPIPYSWGAFARLASQDSTMQSHTVARLEGLFHAGGAGRAGLGFKCVSRSRVWGGGGRAAACVRAVKQTQQHRGTRFSDKWGVGRAVWFHFFNRFRGRHRDCSWQRARQRVHTVLICTPPSRFSCLPVSRVYLWKSRFWGHQMQNHRSFTHEGLFGVSPGDATLRRRHASMPN